MLLHTLNPQRCTENIHLEENELRCSKCGRYIGHFYQDRLCLLSGFKKYESKIRSSRAIEEYTKQRDKMATTQDAEWRSFLRDLKFDEDEILPLETTDEWVPEDCEWGNAAGCS